jgi:hypothetical protein
MQNLVRGPSEQNGNVRMVGKQGGELTSRLECPLAREK